MDKIYFINRNITAFIVWASNELNIFTTHFIKQVFISQTSLTTVTECVMLAKSQCDRVNNKQSISFIRN